MNVSVEMNIRKALLVPILLMIGCLCQIPTDAVAQSSPIKEITPPLSTPLPEPSNPIDIAREESEKAKKEIKEIDEILTKIERQSNDLADIATDFRGMALNFGITLKGMIRGEANCLQLKFLFDEEQKLSELPHEEVLAQEQEVDSCYSKLNGDSDRLMIMEDDVHAMIVELEKIERDVRRSTATLQYRKDRRDMLLSLIDFWTNKTNQLKKRKNQ